LGDGTITDKHASVLSGLPLAGDFNNDGNIDILWRNNVSGDVAVCYMNETTLMSGALIYSGIPLFWEIAAHE
jgi:hypothetical protein